MINCKCKGEKNAQKIIKTLLVFEALWQLSFEAIIFGLLLDLAAVQQRKKKILSLVFSSIRSTLVCHLMHQAEI